MSRTLYTLLLSCQASHCTLCCCTLCCCTLCCCTLCCCTLDQSQSYRSIIELPFNQRRTFNGSILRGPYFRLELEIVPLCKLAQTSGRSPGRFRVMPTWDRDFTQPGYVDNALAVHIIIVMIRSTFVIAIHCYSGAQDLVQPRLLGRLPSWTARIHRRSGAIVSGCAP